MIQWLERLDDNLEKAARVRTKFDRLTGTGQIRYEPNLMPIPAGLGESLQNNQPKSIQGAHRIPNQMVFRGRQAETRGHCVAVKY